MRALILRIWCPEAKSLPASPFATSLLDQTGYSQTLIRFWRQPSHREALEVLALAITHSGEADYLNYEWSLIRDGNHAEFELRRTWALELAVYPDQDPVGWRYSPTWNHIQHVFGPAPERHRACLCRWLHGKPYPSSVNGGGGMGDAGGRARRIIADLDQARAAAPRGLTEYELEKFMSLLLGSALT